MEIRFLFCLLLALTINIGCDKKNYCTGGIQIEDVRLSFRLVDSNGLSIIGDFGKKYGIEDVKFLNTTGVTTGFDIQGDGMIFFNLESGQHGNDTIATEYNLILDPVPSFPYEDIDTINVVIILQRLPDCEYPILNQFLVSFNDSLYYSNSVITNTLNFYKL
ncbi:MAG: hypothetical protein IT270_11695 [Saprospiraceae bacterium]|nr:hypothetical protein [Saprospiraceae bacterium]